MKKIVSAILCMFISTGLVYADRDWKSYPATACVPEGTPSGSSDMVYYDNVGGICNLSAQQDIDIICPVVRDFSRSRMPIETRHSGRSGNSNQDLTCVLRNMRTQAEDSGTAMGGFFATLTPIPIHSTDQFSVRQVITDLRHLAIDNHDFGGTVFACRLPRSNFRVDTSNVTSCLYNYSIYEWDGQ